MNVEIKQCAHRIIRVGGEIDYGNVQPFKDALEEAVLDSPQGFVVDLSDVTYFDSSGVRLIIYAWQRVHDSGGSIAIVAVTPGISRILGIINADKLPRLFICDSVEAADEALAAAENAKA